MKTLPSRLLHGLVNNPLLVLLVLMVVAVQSVTGAQLNALNLRGVLLDASVIAIVAIPSAMLVIAGYLDLSVGSVLALGGVSAALVMQSLGSAPLAVLVSILVGALVGVVNALLIVVMGLSPFITTLGTLAAVRGAAQLLAPLPLSGFDVGFTQLGVGAVAGIPIPAIIALVLVVLAGLFLTLTPSGRHVYAIGVNREAAYLSGVATRRLPFLLYVMTGAAAGLAGAITVARLNSAPSGQLGTGYELSVLAAVLLGGIALTGGSGNMFGVVVGVLFMGMLANSLTLLGVPAFWQNVASGVALVAAIVINAGTQRLRRRLVARDAQRLARIGGPGAKDPAEHVPVAAP